MLNTSPKGGDFGVLFDQTALHAASNDAGHFVGNHLKK